MNLCPIEFPLCCYRTISEKVHQGLLPTKALHLKCPYRATAAIPAGIAVTLADLVLAVDAGEAGFARTRVAALASVHASCSIFAWPVVSAVVQICKDTRS